MKWTVKKWINIGFVATLLILAIISLVSIRSTYQLIDTNRSLTQKHQMLEKIDNVFSLPKDSQSGKPKLDEIHRIMAEDELNLTQETKKAEKVAETAITIIILGWIFAFLAAGFAVWVINRGMVERERANKDLRYDKERYHWLTETMHDGFLIQSHGRFTYVNEPLCQMLGYTREEMIGQSLDTFIHETNQAIMAEDADRRSKGERKFHEIPWTSKSGKHIHTIVSPEPFFDNEGIYQGSIAVVTDLSELKLMGDKLRELSLHDGLTGLYSRQGFLNLADQQLRVAKRINRKVLLLSIDLDRMKWTNNTLGHSEGDRALQGLANILKENFRESDVIARIGGDEFAVLLFDSADSKADVYRLRLQKGLMTLRTFDPPLSVSVGITQYDSANPVSLEKLLMDADSLMNEDKTNNKRK